MRRHFKHNRLGLAVWLICVIALLPACDPAFPPPPSTEIVPEPTSSLAPQSSSTASAPTGTPTETATPASQLEIGVEDLRGEIIHFWHSWSGPLGKAAQSLIEEFNLSNEWGIIVVPVYHSSYDELLVNLKASVEAGETPDLVVLYPHQALAWEATQGLVDLRTYADDPIWGFTAEEQADFYPLFWEQDVPDGKRLGVPAQRYSQVLYYNKTWAQELGYSVPPVLPEQFQEQACAAARFNRQDGRPENDGTGGWIVSTDYAAMLGWIYAFGGEIVKSPEPGLNQPVYQFNTPEMEDAFTFLKGLYDAGCAWLAESQYPEAEFASRQGLFATGSTADIPHQTDAFRRAGNADQWVVIPFPSPNLNPAIDVYGPSFSMLPSSPEKQLAAWLLIKWLTAPHNQARLAEASGAFPVRLSSSSDLEGYQKRYPQWAAALELLSRARSEPMFQSWGTVRWALSDASTQLFRSYFTLEQVPTLLAYLDRVAADLHIGPEQSGVYHTPTITPTPSPTATRTRLPTATTPPTRTPRPAASPSPGP